MNQESVAYHIITRVGVGGLLFGDVEKEYFVRLLEILAQGFYVEIYAFAVLGSHFICWLEFFHRACPQIFGYFVCWSIIWTIFSVFGPGTGGFAWSSGGTPINC